MLALVDCSGDDVWVMFSRPMRNGVVASRFGIAHDMKVRPCWPRSKRGCLSDVKT